MTRRCRSPAHDSMLIFAPAVLILTSRWSDRPASPEDLLSLESHTSPADHAAVFSGWRFFASRYARLREEESGELLIEPHAGRIRELIEDVATPIQPFVQDCRSSRPLVERRSTKRTRPADRAARHAIAGRRVRGVRSRTRQYVPRGAAATRSRGFASHGLETVPPRTDDAGTLTPCRPTGDTAAQAAACSCSARH
jgi:hypothetical protein